MVVDTDARITDAADCGVGDRIQLRKHCAAGLCLKPLHVLVVHLSTINLIAFGLGRK